LCLRESCMRENRTYSLSGGRWPARKRATSDPTARKRVMTAERRAEELKNGANEGTGTVQRDPRRGEPQQREPPCACRRQKRCNRGGPKAMDLNTEPRTFRKRAMYENLMEAVVREENCKLALVAVTRNQGAAGIDRMKTTELEKHLEAHWEKIRTKLLTGTYVPSPVRRVEIPKPSGGVRMLGIPTAVAGTDADLRADVQRA